ncbi:Peptidase S8/S53 domain protein [Kalmanozyma brasiliensis GHG001]|uniref:Serine protease n=1 Tax=Kalmanozyma brasiliensis (strain GHG001) TaxID=1365824 RepID=V5EZL0_KALBG|nr:Peptidase S8/S53 domain protein [Kalmanozyma brasiliensis GHG001]EST09363.1 Peptidase S8/S53 domain protein [Kalmanozyma brasiliensis GHG001]
MYTKRYLGLLALALSLPLAALAAPTHQPFVPGSSANAYSPSTEFAPLTANPDLETIPGSYMIVLKDGINSNDFFAHQSLISSAQLSANSFHGEDAQGIRHVYDLEGHLQGYAGKFTDDVLDYIRAQPEVEYVEMDTLVSVEVMPQTEDKVWDVEYDANLEDATLAAMNVGKLDAKDTQKGAPWGLARVSHRKRLGLSTFNKYVYQGDGGEGVTAYVIDTGININHVEFEGRARWGKTMPQNDVDQDGNGHGTHCAGTIGSRKYGVAKKAELVAVKVLGSGGSGSMSDVTGGVLWAVEDAKRLTAQYRANPQSAAAKKHKGFVANMSLGGGKSPTLDKAVNGAVTSGMHFGVAAGNENQDACNVSPAGATNPVTVGASTVQDERAYFSNKGKCVDIFAPGLNILSTWNTGNTSVNTISGTSMASPHIVGLLAYLLSIYGTDDFKLLTGGSKQRSIAEVEDSLAAKLSGVMPIPAMALDLVSSVAGYFTEDAAKPDIDSVLSTTEMKKALIKLASPGVLTGLDSDTVNKLAFNNATTTA